VFVRLLAVLHLGAHGGVELAEALAQAGLGRHGLEHAAADATVLAAREGLGGEVVDARGEAVVDEVTEDLCLVYNWLISPIRLSLSLSSWRHGYV